MTAIEELMAFPAYVREKNMLASHLLCTFLKKYSFFKACAVNFLSSILKVVGNEK